MSDTPRTDALICDTETFCFDPSDLKPAMELVSFARQLERDLKEANASHVKTLLICEKTINELRAQLDAWKKMVEELADCVSGRAYGVHELRICEKETLAKFNQMKEGK